MKYLIAYSAGKVFPEPVWAVVKTCLESSTLPNRSIETSSVEK